MADAGDGASSSHAHHTFHARYKRKGVIGSGTYGKVYKVVPSALRQPRCAAGYVVAKKRVASQRISGSLALIRARLRQVECLDDGMPYVMKRVTLAQNTEADKKQAMTEVEVLSALRHPHIVPYKECYWVSHLALLYAVGFHSSKGRQLRQTFRVAGLVEVMVFCCAG
jgi:serine/threonine protein kinase